MKKTVGILSVLLALTIAVNAITPAMSVTIQDVFSQEPQAASISDSVYEPFDDYAVADRKKSNGSVPNQKEVAFDDGKILIYNFTQLSMIGSGKSYKYEDGVTATYASDAEYKLARDIPIPRHTIWQLPDDFRGKITGEKQAYAPLYDNASDSVYLYNPYQLAVMAMDNADKQTVLSGDMEAKTFGTGQPVCRDKDCKALLTYSSEHNYVVSSQFSTEVSEKPVSVLDKSSEIAVGSKTDGSADAKADSPVGAASNDGRDFAGQVIKKINGETYILIGNEDQLRAIGTDAYVYTPVYELHLVGTHYEVLTSNGKQVQLYGGDADLEESQNGYADFSFQDIHSGHPRAGVNQETGQVYTDAAHVDISWPDALHSWRTGEKYTTNANYIIFRDIDLGGSERPWKPLMFSGTMYGAKSANGEDLWDSNGLTATTEVNRPQIKNVYVNTDSIYSDHKLRVNDFIGVGFFATISNKTNTDNFGISGGTAIVKNLDLNNVHVENNANDAMVDQTILNTVTSGLGLVVGALVDLLLTILSFGSTSTDLKSTLENLLNARAQDPTIYSTGAFAGRIYGDVIVEDCRVKGAVEVSNVKDRTGGFVGYTEGLTEYSGLSTALGTVSSALAAILNAIPAIGLGDLVNILLDNALPVGKLIPTGYKAPKLKNCEVNGLTGDVGTASTDMAGGFAGQQIGTRIDGCSVSNSTYHIKANNYGGGFTGLERDAVIKGTLDGVGIDVNTLIESIGNIHPQSVLTDCKILGSTYRVTGGNCLGGFVGAMAGSYAVDCKTDCPQHPISVQGTGDYVGGFTGYATVGWLSNLGENENDEKSLLGTVRQLLTGLLSEHPSAQQQLLSLMGIAPSAILGCQIYSSQLEVEANGSFAGGIVGKGDGLYLGKSDQAAYTELAAWNSGTIKQIAENQSIILNGIKSVRAHQNYAGGIAGYLGSADFEGLLNATIGLGKFISFTARDIIVTGISGGYTVKADNYDAGGGFGTAIGGTITNVKLNELKSVEAFNRAAGFVGIAGPGELAGTGGLTVNLLGLDRLLSVNNLLNIGEGVEVHITDCDVNGINSGYTVEATGANTPGSENVYDFTAAGFIADSNSTKITNSHCYKLMSVTATDKNGFAGGFIGTSQTGGFAEAANNDATQVKSLIQANGLVRAIQYLIPSYTNCTTNFVDSGFVDADIAGGFVADFESGTVDNSTIATVDDAQNPKWTHSMKELYDPEAVNATGDLNKQFAVINIDRVHGRTYGGGFGGKLRSGALASAGGGISILGSTGLSIGIDDLINVMNSYVPYIKHAGVYSQNGFTVSANEVRSDDSNSGSAGGFGGYMSGAQISQCDVYRLKNTPVTPPSDLEAVSAPSYFNNQSNYAVTGGHFAGGYAGIADIGSAASIGGSLGVLGDALNLQNILKALSVVVTTVEHSDVQGGEGGFSAIANGTDQYGAVGKSGGYAGAINGAHIQNSHCKNFYYIIGQESAGGYVGTMKPGNVAGLLNNTSILSNLVNADNLLNLIETFIPTIRNSTTSCVPCGGAVRAQAASNDSHQRGCAGGYCGYNEGGHIWGLNNATWQDQNNGVIGRLDFGHIREGSYTGEQHRASAWRIRSVYGAEYAGGYTGIMQNADTADTGGISLLVGLIKADNILTALSVIYSKQEHTAVYGPLRNIDYQTWNSWVNYIGKHGGYGIELAASGAVNSQAELDNKLSKYIYGYNVVAGRAAHDGSIKFKGGDAGGYVGLMYSGIVTDGQAYDAKAVKAMRDAGGFAGSMQTGGVASFGSLSIAGLNLNLSDLISAAEVLVPKVESSSVNGWQSGMTVTATGTDFLNHCGYAGGYVGSAYGAQIWGDHNADGYQATGCNVSNLRYVRGNNAAGGYAGISTAAGMANANTNASDGFLQQLLNSVVSNKDSIAKVLQATATDIVKAQVSPDDSSFGFVVEGTGGNTPLYSGGFAGMLEATMVGVHSDNLATDTAAENNIIVNGLRSVKAQYYAGGFFGLADVTGVANVTNSGETDILGRLVSAGEISVIDAFRSYVYYSEINGVSGDGVVVKATDQGSQAMLNETRYSGCAGGFGGAMMNGTVKHSKVTNINTVYAKNYTGGFIGHMGKSGVVDADSAEVAKLVGLTAGVFDIFSTHTKYCEAYGIPVGAVIMSTGGTEPISGGFVGYADISKINNCKTENLKQVYSDQIAGGFVGKTDMHYLINVNANSPLVTGVEAILNLLLKGLLVNDIENIDLIGLNLGIAELNVLTDGDVIYINLLGLRIGVSLVKDNEGQTTDTALVTIGDSYIVLPYNDDGFVYDNNSSAAVINLIKGNRTHIENCSVKGIDIGYDVYGGGAGNDHDGSGTSGKTGGFVGFNNEGHLLNNRMEYCDVVRGAPQMTGPFSGNTSLQSVYSFNTLQSIEGENNVYSVYRQTDLTNALTRDKQLIKNNPVTDNGYKRFDITHLSEPIIPAENEAYYKIFEKWYNAVLASDAQGTDKSRIKVYNSSAMAVLMLDTPTELNDESLIPNPGESKDPCDQTIKLTIQKVWQDQNNKNGTRPDLIKVRLWQHWLNENGTAVMNGSDEKVVLFNDSNVISDIDSNGWFVISKSDHGRSGSATWTRVIEGLPVYTADNNTYYTYTVEESPVVGYNSEVSYDETGTTATAKIVNTLKNYEIQFKYYDRYEIDGAPAGIDSVETVYSVPVNGIPDNLITYDQNHNVQSIDFSVLIGEKAVEFSNNVLGVNNVMCDYDLWTSQSAAVEAMAKRSYFENGKPVKYAENEVYHTDYLGKPKSHSGYSGQDSSASEKWVNYYDSKGVELTENTDHLNVNKIVVWCYNYPKQYNVDIYGADSSDDVVQKTVAGNTVFVANAKSTDNNVKHLNDKFYYNQRFGGETENNAQDSEGFIQKYGLYGYTNVMPSDYAAESFGDYNFAYWAYDQEGTQIASVDRDFWYRVTTDTKLYAVYASNSSSPGISISANTNDTYVDSSGVSRTRLNILASVYGAPVYDTNVQKLSFVNISLSEQIRSHPEIYTPEKINTLFEQYKDQLKSIIQKNDKDNGSKSFSSDETYIGDIDEETGEVNNLSLTLTSKGYIYTVVSNGNEAEEGDSTATLTNKNRTQFTISYKTSALNINHTNSKGNTCLMYCGALKYNGEWNVSTNCLIYYNGKAVNNADDHWE